MVFKILKPSASFHAVEYNENKQAKGHAENVHFENFGYLQDKHTAIKAYSSFYAVDYNENKQDTGQAEQIHHQNFSGLPEKETLTKAELKKYLEDYSARNSRIKNPQFHAILSCKGQEKTFDELKDHALEIMKRLGYANNPMLMYEHRDTKNNHIHIVTSRVAPDGKKINHNLEAKRANRILNEIMKLDTKEAFQKVLDKSLSYNISTVPQFKLLMEQQGYNVKEKDGDILFFRHGTGQGAVSKKTIEDKISTRTLDTKRTRQIKALIHKYKLDHSPEIIKDKNPNIHTSVKPTYHSDLTNHLHSTFGLLFVFHGDKNKEPYGYTIIDHKQRSVYKGSEVMKLEQLRTPLTPEQKEDQKNTLKQKQGETERATSGANTNERTSSPDKEKTAKENMTNKSENSSDEFSINTGLASIISGTLRDVDSEANTSGQKKRRKHQRKL